MTDFVEMFRHWNAGRSQVQISEALGIDRKTIRKYVAPVAGRGSATQPRGVRRGAMAGTDQAVVPGVDGSDGAGGDLAADRGAALRCGCSR